MELEMVPLIGMGRYPVNNEFLDKYKKVKGNQLLPKIPIGYDKTKIIEINNGINRKIPAIQTVFRFWVFNEEKEYLSTGFDKLDLGKNWYVNTTITSVIFIEKAQTLVQQIYVLNFILANSYQNDQFYSQLNDKEYADYTKKMPALPCFTSDQSPIEYARKFCSVLDKMRPQIHRSQYFPIWLHNLLVNRPLFFIDKIDDSIFGGELQSPRLIQPKNLSTTKFDESFDERNQHYMTGFDTNINTSEILEGTRMILREIYCVLGRYRTMSIITGKWSNIRIVSNQTLEIEIHVIGTVMQHGIQPAIRDFFLKKNPRMVNTYHFGIEVTEKELERALGFDTQET